MFYKIAAISLLLSSFLLAKQSNFQSEGVSVQMIDAGGQIKHRVVKRDIPDECKKVPINNTMVWKGNYANAKVPEACKSTYVHTTGNLLPMQLHEDINTYGELEVLAFIKHMQKDDSMLLIDGRKQEWNDYRTIPGAKKIPYNKINKPKNIELQY